MYDAALSELKRILRDVLDDPHISVASSTSLRDVPSWDSGKTVMLILAVEEHFRITLKASDIDRLRTIDDWVHLIAARGVHG